jgi:hypothetical protein
MARPVKGLDEVAVRIPSTVYHAARILVQRNPEKFPNIPAAIEAIFDERCPNEMAASRTMLETMKNAVNSN